MSQFRILIVDDEAEQRKTLAGFLRKKGYEVHQADHGKTALELIETESIDLVLTDLRMPEMDGSELLKSIKTVNPMIEVILMTAFGSVNTAVDAMREGAFTFITKPVDLKSLLAQIERALERKMLLEENLQLKVRLGDSPVSRMIAHSEEMKSVLDIVSRVAPAKSSVLILGESGTGKEMIARALHDASPRREKMFVPVNIAAIPETLLESDLFGHEKGAFTGAVARHPGRFERASGGTLFIDEIGDMPPFAQVKLLRVLQEGIIERVGGVSPVPVDVRVVAATHRDLDMEVREGRFREDLFYRLNVVRIKIPPLRNRKVDIPPLVEHFIEKYCRLNGKQVDGIDAHAMDALMKHSWPGNVRELENAIESAVVLSRNRILSLQDMPPVFRSVADKEIAGRLLEEDDPSRPLLERLELFEKSEVLRVLEETDGNRSEAARRLGMSEKNIRDRLKRWGIS